MADWNEVRGYLDDPNVSDDTKKRLLSAYAWQHPHDFKHWGDEAGKLGVKMGLDGPDSKTPSVPSPFLPGMVAPSGKHDGATDKYIQTAKSDQGAAKQKAGLDKVKDKTSDGGGSGVDTAAELLDQGNNGLKFFDLFWQVYQDWNKRPYDLKSLDQAREWYGREAGLIFKDFRADADLIGGLAKSLDSTYGDLDSYLRDLAIAWTQGTGRQAALDRFNILLQTADLVNGDLAAVPDTMHSVIAAMESAVYNKAAEVGQLYTNKIHNLSPGAIEVVIKMCRNNASEYEMFEIADLLGVKVDTHCDHLTDDTKVRIANSANQFMNNVFNPTYEKAEDDFANICLNTTKSMNTYFDQLTKAVTSLPTTAFANLAKPPNLVPIGSPTGASQPGSPVMPGGPGGPGATVSSSAGSSGGGSGGGTGASGGGSGGGSGSSGAGSGSGAGGSNGSFHVPTFPSSGGASSGGSGSGSGGSGSGSGSGSGVGAGSSAGGQNGANGSGSVNVPSFPSGASGSNGGTAGSPSGTGAGRSPVPGRTPGIDNYPNTTGSTPGADSCGAGGSVPIPTFPGGTSGVGSHIAPIPNATVPTGTVGRFASFDSLNGAAAATHASSFDPSSTSLSMGPTPGHPSGSNAAGSSNFVPPSFGGGSGGGSGGSLGGGVSSGGSGLSAAAGSSGGGGVNLPAFPSGGGPAGGGSASGGSPTTSGGGSAGPGADVSSRSSGSAPGSSGGTPSSGANPDQNGGSGGTASPAGAAGHPGGAGAMPMGGGGRGGGRGEERQRSPYRLDGDLVGDDELEQWERLGPVIGQST